MQVKTILPSEFVYFSQAKTVPHATNALIEKIKHIVVGEP